jgi:hypothetical protein
MSITTVLIVPHAFLKAFGTVLRPFLDRASKKTNQPSRRCLCFMYVASWAGPMTSFRFKILSSTTCTSPDEKVTRTSTYPMPDLASRISVPRFSSFALAKRPKHSWPCNSGFLLSFPFARESQNESITSASIEFLNASRNLRMLSLGKPATRLPEASIFAATAFETNRRLFF